MTETGNPKNKIRRMLQTTVAPANGVTHIHVGSGDEAGDGDTKNSTYYLIHIALRGVVLALVLRLLPL